MSKRPPFELMNFDQSPMLVFYEVTRSCDLVCRHCRACAQPRSHPDQLSSEHALALIDQLKRFPTPPLLVFTGGDPFKREDIFTLIAYALEQGLKVAVTPSATPLVTHNALKCLKELGVHRLAVSLDGADAQTHDHFRGWSGSFQRTMEILEDAREIGLPLQVNTTITRHNVEQVDRIADWLGDKGLVLWSVFFLVPVGRGMQRQMIAPETYEEVFAKLYAQSQRQPYAIKTTEAHHYRRYVLQHTQPDAFAKQPTDPGPRRPIGINDGKGVMFISHTGEIFPSGFMPIDCGRFPHDSIVQTYQQHPTFQAMRKPDEFHGKCGVCEFKQVCGGSRARAYAVTGDPLASEPDCIYTPQAFAATSIA